MHPVPPSRPLRRLLARTITTTAVGVVLLGLTACGGDTQGGGTQKEPKLQSGSYETALIEWREAMDDCMLKAGFDIVPKSNGDGSTEPLDTSKFDMVEFDKAYGVCTADVGETPVDPDQPTEEEMFQSQLVFAGCMREKGYDVPDPVRGSGGMGQAFGPETNGDDVDACSDKAYEVGDEK